MRCYWNFWRATLAAVLLLNDKICIGDFHCDLLGRIMHLDFSFNNLTNFRIINAYFSTEEEARREFIDNYSQYLIGAKTLILGGDFNFILNLKLDKVGGNLETGMVSAILIKPILANFKLIDAFRHLFFQKRYL